MTFMSTKVLVHSLCLYSFLLAIILIRLPNIYFLPFVTSGIFTTQAVARVILVILFFVGFFLFRQKTFLQTHDSRIIVTLLLGFLVTSSLSLLWAQNVEAFFSRYKDLVIGIVSFFVFSFFAQEKRKIVIAFLIPIPLNILYQFLLLYGKSIFFFLEGIIYQKHFDLVSYNLSRGRLYMDVYDEAFISLIFLFLNTKKRLQFFFVSLLILLISYVALLSNFRTRIIMLFLGICSSLLMLKRVSFKRLFLIIVVICLFVSVVIVAFSNIFGWTFQDRILFSHQSEDIDTIVSRYEQIENSVEMGFSSLFGVGLGNYYDNLSDGKSIYDPFTPVKNENTAYQFVHNNLATVIAESGYISFFFYVALLVKFSMLDYETIRKKDTYKKAFVISFWLLFFFGMFNPPIPGSYQILFWGIRGLLI